MPQEECTDQLGVASVIQDEIFWLEVPVNDSFGMQIGKGFHHACCVKSGRRIFKWTSEIQKTESTWDLSFSDMILFMFSHFLIFLCHSLTPEPNVLWPNVTGLVLALGFQEHMRIKSRNSFALRKGWLNLTCTPEEELNHTARLWTWPCPLMRHSLWSGGDESYFRGLFCKGSL